MQLSLHFVFSLSIIVLLSTRTARADDATRWNIKPKQIFDSREPQFAAANQVYGELDLSGLPSGFGSAAIIDVQLFPEMKMPEFERVGHQIASDGFHGENSNGDVLNLIDYQGMVFGSVIEAETGKVYQIKEIDGVSTTEMIDSFPPELDPQEEDGISPIWPLIQNPWDNEESGLPRRYENEDGGRRQLQSKIVIDVMVLWSRKAECGESNKSANCNVNSNTYNAMMALSRLAIQETNVAFQQSGINAEVRLVHADRHAYNEPNSNAFTHALSSVKTSAKKLRNDKGADLVHMMIDDPKYCGVANIGPREDLAYSISNYRCATGYFSFGHELAHSMGCLHDRGTHNQCNSGNINYGYRDPNANFRSIMSYSCRSGQCDNNKGGGCTRVQRFSNTAYKYGGRPIGDAKSNNAKYLNAGPLAQVAAFRKDPNAAPPPTVPPPTSQPTPTPTKVSCGNGEASIEFNLKTDRFPQDISWKITRKSNGNVVMDGDGYTGKEMMYSRSACVIDTEYIFTLVDKEGDGLCCTYSNQGRGFINLQYNDTIVFDNVADFGDGFGPVSFGTTVETNKPSSKPSEYPTRGPTNDPTAFPTNSPTSKPTIPPTALPTTSPTKGPTESPTDLPTKSPTQKPTVSPTTQITEAPTAVPTATPTQSPTTSPTKRPTNSPTNLPTARPATRSPTTSPTKRPTNSPTNLPTSLPPTRSPTTSPTASPTKRPTNSPTNPPTPSPTTSPTKRPTVSPTKLPTARPTTRSPSKRPTAYPTKEPTAKPTNPPVHWSQNIVNYFGNTSNQFNAPASKPTVPPTALPTTSPTKGPTESPTDLPTKSPTQKPTAAPTQSPTTSPTKRPTNSPTNLPTARPATRSPTTSPTKRPTNSPTNLPTARPATRSPTTSPTKRPTNSPTNLPTSRPPTRSPTTSPTKRPTNSPTNPPTPSPTTSPTKRPTISPTKLPTARPTTGSPTKRPTAYPTKELTAKPTKPPVHWSQNIPNYFNRQKESIVAYSWGDHPWNNRRTRQLRRNLH